MADITNNWNKTMPSGTSLVSQGDDLMRQHWNSLEITLEEEHYFDDSKTSAGIHKAGASRFSYGNASSLKTTAEEGRAFYAVDTETLYITGSSATTSVAGSQQGGPVKSVLSAAHGYYIMSYRTAQKQSTSAYSYVNAAGSPTLVFHDTPVVLGVAWEQAKSSATSISVPVLYSVTSSALKCTIARYSEDMGDVGTATTGFEASGLVSGLLHISVMGYLPFSQLS